MQMYKKTFVLDKGNKFFLYNPYSNSSCFIDKLNNSLSDSIRNNYKKLLDSYVIFQNDEDYYNVADFFSNKEKYNFNTITFTEAMSFDCNLKCVYCMQQNTPKHLKKITPQERVDIWTRLIEIFGSTNINVCLFGGEPFYDINYVIDLLQESSNRKIKLNNLFAVTNGTICNDIILNLFNKYNFHSIQVTIDGGRDIHNSRRISKKQSSSYDAIIENIKKILEQTNTRIYINTVLDKSNANDYINMVNELIVLFEEEIYADSPRIIFNLGNECQPYNKSTYNTENAFQNPQELDDFYLNLLALVDLGVGINMLFPSQECLKNYCTEFIIGPDGSLYSCISGIGIEEFKICSHDEIFNNPGKFLFQSIKSSATSKDAKCYKCDYYAFCNGGCYYDKIVEDLPSSCQKHIFNATIDKIVELASKVEEIEPGLYRKRRY